MLVVDRVVGGQLLEFFQLRGNYSLGSGDSSKESLIGGQEVSKLAGIQVDKGFHQLIELVDYFVRMSDPAFGGNDPGRIPVKHETNNQRDDKCEQKTGQDLSFNSAEYHELS